MYYKAYESFNLNYKMIESMVRDMIEKEDDYDIEILHYFFNRRRYQIADAAVKREDIIRSILCQIHEIAEDEEIKYSKKIDFIKYSKDNLIIVAEVIKRIGPNDYVINAFSNTTNLWGEQVVVDLTWLEEDSPLELITWIEYERAMMFLIVDNLKRILATHSRRDILLKK
jgi:hypothetical protein